jgi:hypothetical protein
MGRQALETHPRQSESSKRWSGCCCLSCTAFYFVQARRPCGKLHAQKKSLFEQENMSKKKAWKQEVGAGG